jgi:hypothetical protein
MVVSMHSFQTKMPVGSRADTNFVACFFFFFSFLTFISYEALKAQYIGAGKKTSAISKQERERMWDLFRAYERVRKEGHFYDNVSCPLFRVSHIAVTFGTKPTDFHIHCKFVAPYAQNDLVADLYRRLCLYGRCGVYFHRLYIDEVQDFTMVR